MEESLIAPTEELLKSATRHHQAGRWAEAETGYRTVLEREPANAEALHGLGALALAADQPEMAEELLSRALAVRSDWPQAWYHLGVAQQGREQFAQAIISHRRALAADPDLFDAQYNLAVCLQLTGQRDKAIAAFGDALALREDDPFALVNFAIALRGAGRLDEAIAALRQAVGIKPDFADAYAQLGKTLCEKDLLDESAAALGQAVKLAPQARKIWADLAGVLRELGRTDQAISAIQNAIALRPNDADANWMLGVLLLLRGDWAAGFAQLEWRWRRKTLPWPRRKFTQPRWDGSDLAGKSIYLHAEQSIGDTLQFVRFLPMVGHLGGRMVVECQQSLRRLFAGSFEAAEWFSPGDPLPVFDVYCPLLSLPTAMGMIPAETPYLRVPAERAENWRRKLAGAGGELKVGLAWAGSRSEVEDRRRSMALSELAPLAQVPGVRFFSLQKGPAAMQARDSAGGITLADFTEELHDFADTAALVGELDLVISVDTAVAHLAGALGKPVWTLLPTAASWRWTASGEKTLWYPTMRLFRQVQRDQWSDPIRRAAGELARLASVGRRPAIRNGREEPGHG